jgi:hypothetical protein
MFFAHKLNLLVQCCFCERACACFLSHPPNLSVQVCPLGSYCPFGVFVSLGTGFALQDAFNQFSTEAEAQAFCSSDAACFGYIRNASMYQVTRQLPVIAIQNTLIKAFLKVSAPVLCPPGVFGNTTSLSTAACSGPCATGFNCSAGSNSSTPAPCIGYQSCSAFVGNCGSVLDVCNNRSITCGPTVCFAPYPIGWSVAIDTNNLTQPLTVQVRFNQSVTPAALSVVAVVSQLSSIVASFWAPSASVTTTARSAAAMSCRNTSWLPGTGVVAQDIRISANLVNCTGIGGLTFAASWINTSTLLFRLPPAVFQFSQQQYQLQLLAGRWCSTLAPMYCMASVISISIVTPTIPVVKPTNVSVVLTNSMVTTAPALVLTPFIGTATFAPCLNISTMSVPADVSSLRISLSNPVIAGMAIAVAYVPLSLSQFQVALAGCASVGVWSWNNFSTTVFDDRYVLHPDATPGGMLPVRVSTNCVVAAGSLSVDCPLPANAVGSFWQVYTAWGISLDDGSVAVASPLLTADWAGLQPLTLSFPLLSINATATKRFVLNPYTNMRSPPGNFVPGDAQTSGFDSTGVTMANGILSFAAVPQVQVPESLFFHATDRFAPVSSLNGLQIFIRCIVELC